MTGVKLATYNVNGVNGRLPVLLRWLAEAEPDIVCLQELKSLDERFPESALREAGYAAAWHGQKSWNGVAILSRGGEIARPKAKTPQTPQPKPRAAKPKRPPKPSREAVRLAKQGVRTAEKRAVQRLAELAAREKALAEERRRLERELSAEKLRHETRLRGAEEAYEAALADWLRG